MNLIIKIVLIALISFLAEQVFPWWSVVICAAFVAALIPTKSTNAFLSGFLAIGLLWLMCSITYSLQADFILTERVAKVFGVNSPAVIILATSLIGAIAGGMGALCGNQLRQMVHYKSPYKSRHLN